MSRAELDLVAAIRAELSAVDPARRCDRRAEAAGLGTDRFTREGPVARLALRLDAGRDANPFQWQGAAEHCRLAYLRGRFLARGSLSLANTRTHVEFVVPASEAPVLAAQLRDLEMPAAWRVRRGRGVVYWKSADVLETFLRRIGASGALLELEARRVSRAMRGDLNRVINAESANLERVVGAAARQLAAIDVLEHDGDLAHQPESVRRVAGARRETPEATFAEIAERLAMNRSRVQRALRRLEALAADGERRPRTPRKRAVALA